MGISCSLTKTLENKSLQWYGHVERMSEERWPKKILQWPPKGKRARGRPPINGTHSSPKQWKNGT
ncbi:hypothetical protein C0J52_10641 [Blattella germanica]|nr:hypothetical protein C0J52_10641 [Blattella germanica]